MNTIDKLEKLADLKTTVEIQRAKLDAQKQALIATVLTDDVKQKLAEIDAEFKPKYGVLEKTDTQIAELEAAVREDVLGAGQTIAGTRLQMVYVKGRDSWDSKGLSGYAIDHPEIERFHEVGKPSTSLRKVA